VSVARIIAPFIIIFSLLWEAQTLRIPPPWSTGKPRWQSWCPWLRHSHLPRTSKRLRASN